jgi:hypothetical protein
MQLLHLPKPTLLKLGTKPLHHIERHDINRMHKPHPITLLHPQHPHLSLRRPLATPIKPSSQPPTPAPHSSLGIIMVVVHSRAQPRQRISSMIPIGLRARLVPHPALLPRLLRARQQIPHQRRLVPHILRSLLLAGAETRLQEGPGPADPLAVARVDELVRAPRESPLGLRLLARHPAQQGRGVEVLGDDFVRGVDHAQAAHCEEGVGAVGFVAGRGADAAFVRLQGADVLAQAVGESFEARVAGWGGRGEFEGEVEDGEHDEGAVGAADVHFGVFGHAEAAVGLLDLAEPLPHCVAVDVLEAVDHGEGEDAGVAGGAVGELAVAAAVAAPGVLHGGDGLDQALAVLHHVLAEDGQAGEAPVEEPGSGGVEGDVGRGQVAESGVQEADVLLAAQVGEAVFVEGEVLGVFAEQMGHALVADFGEGLRGWGGELFGEEVEDWRSEPGRHDVSVPFEVATRKRRAATVFRVGELDDFRLLSQEVVQGVV